MALDIFSVFFMSRGKRAGFNCDTVCKRVLSDKDIVNQAGLAYEDREGYHGPLLYLIL